MNDDETRAPSFPTPVRGDRVPAEAPVVFTVDEFMTEGDFGLCVGEDGSMKTAVAIHVACARAGGYRAFGRLATQPCAVLYISEEDSAAVVQNRARAYCVGHGWDEARVLENLWILAKAELRLASMTWRSHVNEIVSLANVGLVIVDPLAEVTEGEENSNTEGRANLQALRGFAKPTGANVWAVHHFGKPGEGKRPKDRIRGNTAVSSGSRFTHSVENDADASELLVTCLKLSRARKPAPFVVRYHIEEEPNQPGVWRSARFDYVTRTQAATDHAETFVLSQLGDGARLTTTDLKKAAVNTGVSGADVSTAIKKLSDAGQIDFEPGPKNAKLWGIRLPEDSRQAGNQANAVAGQSGRLPGNHPQSEFCLPSPVRGKQTAATGEAA